MSLEVCRLVHGPELPEKAFFDLNALQNWYRAVLDAWLNDVLAVADVWRGRLPAQEHELALCYVVLEASNTGVRRLQRCIFRESNGIPRDLRISSYSDLKRWCDFMFELLHDDERHVGQDRHALTFRYDRGAAYRLEEGQNELIAKGGDWVAGMMRALSKGKPHRVEPDDDWILVVWSHLANAKESIREVTVGLFMDAKPQPKLAHTPLLEDMVSATWKAMRQLGPVCRDEPQAASPKYVRKHLDTVKRFCARHEPRSPGDACEKKNDFGRKTVRDIGPTRMVMDSESKDRALVGDVISTVALAGQLSREFNVSDHGIDMEIEFKSDAGEATGRKLYLQLKSGDSHLRKRKRDGAEVFPIKEERHARYWMGQQFPVLLVIRSSKGEIRWMEVRDWLKRESENGKKRVKQIAFEGERFDVMSVRRWRDRALTETAGGG